MYVWPSQRLLPLSLGKGRQRSNHRPESRVGELAVDCGEIRGGGSNFASRFIEMVLGRKGESRHRSRHCGGSSDEAKLFVFVGCRGLEGPGVFFVCASNAWRCPEGREPAMEVIMVREMSKGGEAGPVVLHRIAHHNR